MPPVLTWLGSLELLQASRACPQTPMNREYWLNFMMDSLWRALTPGVAVAAR
jgi:hypothetical protein